MIEFLIKFYTYTIRSSVHISYYEHIGIFSTADHQSSGISLKRTWKKKN